ncbi:hypothetical protein [Rhizosphaericola mali]|uniref:Uncharacterized protein n=1 Tax=Rhizosphaericola mali TaxID=2545455 RepID=A0A5P2G572_9BACT|nr:hypothetical protein [Rhizosphaericola mali]QES90347.1 hypothetical protein E0W69_017370 [Rhizosphaericola mali]
MIFPFSGFLFGHPLFQTPFGDVVFSTERTMISSFHCRLSHVVFTAAAIYLVPYTSFNGEDK